MNDLIRKFSPVMQKINSHKTLALTVAVSLVVGATFVGLSMPATTATPQLICEQEEHTHSGECYEEVKTLICGKEEGEPEGDTVSEALSEEGAEGTEEVQTHTHTEACYETEQVLSCGLEEHTHDEMCYEQAGTLTSETSDHMVAEVAYDAGEIHQDTYLSAKKLENEKADAVLELVNEKLNEKKEYIAESRIYSLELLKNDINVIPDGKVDISMKFDTPIESEGEIEWKLFYIDDNDKTSDITKQNFVEKIKTNENNEVEEIQVETTDFGRYALIGIASVEEETEEQSQSEETAQDDQSRQEQSEQSTDEATAEEIAANYPAQDFESSSNGIKVTVSADEGAFPAGTTMKVSEISDQNVLKKAIAASATEGAQAKAVDISFYDADGNEIEPAQPIRVTMQADEIAATSDVTVVHIDDSNKASVVEQTSNQRLSDEEKPAANEVIFDSDSFSAYAIVYTVDFSYGDYEYSIKGESSILLSQLLKELHIYKEDQTLLTVDDIKDVKFSDKTLVSVSAEGNDWKLTSLKPFETEESLKITLTNGDVIDINVTDDSELDLSSFLTNVDISIGGETITTDKWTIKEGQNYDMTFHFSEAGRNQFVDNDTAMVYTLPEGVYLQSTNGNFDITITSNGNTYTIENCTYTIDANTRTLTVKWNTSDPDFKEMTYANNVKFDIKISGSFDSNQTEFSFSDTVKKTVEVDNSHNASVKKDGYYDSNDGKIHYTVTVSSSGNSENIHVVDTLPSGSAISINPESLVYSGDGSELTSKTVTNNGFDLTISSIPDGGTRTITYTADVDVSKISKSGSATYDDTGNMVQIDVPDDSTPGDNISSHYVSNISFSSLNKNSSSVSDTQEKDGEKYKTVTWNIEANKEKKVSLTYIADSIDASSQGRMSYSGDGLTILVTFEDGRTETRNVPWSSVLNDDGKGWKYNVPSTDGKASYQVSYTTDVKVTSSDITEKNNSSDDYNDTSGSVVVGPDEGDKLKASKIHTNVTPEAITWKITVNVPKDGYSSLEVTDTINAKWLNNILYYDELDKSSIVVSGLTGNETYDVVYTNVNNGVSDNISQMQLIFYKDSNNTTGLNKTSSNRTITIEYITKNSKELREAAAAGSTDLEKHDNSANIKADNVSIDVSDDAWVSETSLKKVGKKSSSEKVTIKNTETGIDEVFYYYEYDLILGNVSSDQQTIYDTFDTSIMKWADTKALNGWGYTDGDRVIYGGNIDWQGTSGNERAIIEETDSGIKIYVDSFPKDANGNFYSYYRIRYYLLIKDEKALLEKAAEAGGVTKIHNSALWNGQPGSCDIEYEYKGLKKELVSSDESNRTATYRLTLNPSALKLNNGNDMTLIDRYENLLINQDSFKITVKGSDEKIAPTFGDGYVQFTIPDEKAVTIEYSARILANPGETYSNTARMSAYTDSSSKTFTFKSSGAGDGSVTAIWLYKYEDGDLAKALSGAQFQLYDSDGNPYLGESGVYEGQPIVFTTDDSGMIRILLENDQIMGGLQIGTTYYLKEIKAPEGYSKSNTLIPFSIVDITTTGRDHLNGKYYIDDILQVSNELKKSVDITLVKRNSLDSNSKLGGAVFNLYGSDYFNSDGSVNKAATVIKNITTSSESDSLGQASLGELDEGTYYLVETKAPDGYVREENPIRIDVGPQNVSLVQGSYNRTYEITNASATIDVTNAQGFNLPKTGGSGTLKYILSGISLMFIALLLYLKRKSEEGRAIQG